MTNTLCTDLALVPVTPVADVPADTVDPKAAYYQARDAAANDATIFDKAFTRKVEALGRVEGRKMARAAAKLSAIDFVKAL